MRGGEGRGGEERGGEEERAFTTSARLCNR